MRSFPDKFTLQNNSVPNKPALIVQIQKDVNYVEQSTQTDWTNATSKSLVDYTPTPPTDGDVILSQTTDAVDDQTQGSSASGFAIYSSPGGYYQHWQAFQNRSGVARKLYSITLHTFVGSNRNAYISIHTAKGGSQIGSTVWQTIGAGGTYPVVDFSGQAIILEPYTTYWFRVQIDGSISEYIYGTTYTPAYSYGNYSYYIPSPRNEWHNDVGDLYFVIRFTGRYGYYYESNGSITTQVMSLSSVPTRAGEWNFLDVMPNGSSLKYFAWACNTATWTFPNSWEQIGYVEDGDAIATLRNFYRVRAEFTANQWRDSSPVVSAIRLDFNEYSVYSNRKEFGYKTYLTKVGNLSSEVDFFEGSTIGQIDITLVNNSETRQLIANAYLKNKQIRVYAGFVADGFSETDFIPYRFGQVSNVSIKENEIIVSMQDYASDWKNKTIPNKWNSATDDVTWQGSYIVDVMIDVLLNQVKTRDSKIDMASFAMVKTYYPAPVNRKFTGNTEDVEEVLDELRLLARSVFIVNETGRTRLLWLGDNGLSTYTVVSTLTDNDFIDISWESNYESVINRASIYSAWVGSGDDTKAFSSYIEAVDSPSQYNFQEIAVWEFKDKWFTMANSQYPLALATYVVSNYGTGRPILKAKVDRKFLFLEVGDVVWAATETCPSSWGIGLFGKSYMVMKTDFDFMNDTIELTMM